MLVTASYIREVTYFARTTFSITLFQQHPKALLFPALIISKWSKYYWLLILWQAIHFLYKHWLANNQKLQLYPLFAEYMDKQAISTSKVNKTLFKF